MSTALNLYARVIDDQPVYARYPHISWPSPITPAAQAYYEQLATADGYKPVINLTAPHRLCRVAWRETDKQVRRDWLELDLETAREQVLSEIIAWSNAFKQESLAQYKFSDVEVLTLGKHYTSDELDAEATARGITTDELEAKIAASTAAGEQLLTYARTEQGRLWELALTATSVAELAALSWGGGEHGST